MRLHRWIIVVASRLVPKAARAEWRAEWESELQHRETMQQTWAGSTRRFDLIRRSAGAFWDAWWLQTSRWYTLRLFGRHWRLATAAIVSLTIAMASAVIGLAAYNAVLVRPPGVGDPASLQLIHVRTGSDAFGSASYPEYREYRTRLRAFSDVAAYPFAISTMQLVAGTRTEQIVGTQVSENFFDVLGIAPRLGRMTLAGAESDRGDLVVISERFWRMLGADPSLVGASIQLNDHPAVVAGIVPQSFNGMTWGFAPDLWMSLKTSLTVLGSSPDQLNNRGMFWLHMVGRLRPGTTAAQAAADAALVSHTIAQDHASEDQTRTGVVTPISVTPPGDRDWTTRIFASLLFVVLLTLVVACANVVNLLLGLAASRRHEMLVRAALGASRLQLVMPLLRESLTVGLLSGALGYGAAAIVLEKLSAWRPSLGGFFPSPSFDLRPDVLVFVAAFGIAIVVGLGVGLLPALRAASEGLSGSLQRESATAGPVRTRLRHVLVVIQMAIATVVLVAVGLSLHSLFNLQHVPLGFSARHLLYTGVDISKAKLDERSGFALYDRVRDAVAADPKIEAVTLASDAPMMGYSTDHVVADVEQAPADGQGDEAPYAVVDDRYFSTLGMTLLAGRGFDSRDVKGRSEVIVINQTMARKHWGTESPIGHHVRIQNGNRPVEVIGVVADGKYQDVDEPQQPFMFFSLTQHYRTDVVVIARTSASRETILLLLDGLDPRLTVGGFGVATLDDMLGLSMLIPRAIVIATMVFAVLALGLAVFGLYSTVFYAVSQRRTEIGIRIALGARAGNLFAMVLRQTGWVALAGGLAGLLAGLALLPVAASLLFGIGSSEPVVIGAVAVISAAVTLLTSYLVIRPWTRLAALDLMKRGT